MFKTWLSKIWLGFIFLSGPAAMGASDHPHDKGPHGGEVHAFGKYHMEGVSKGGIASFYVLADDGKTAASVPKYEGGTVTVIVPGKALEKTDIIPGNSFSETSVKLPLSGKSTVLLTIKVGGANYSTKFNFSN
jgi:hypothetical protein